MPSVQKHLSATRTYKSNHVFMGPVLPIQSKSYKVKPLAKKECVLERLPNEMMLHMFDMLPSQDLATLRSANKRVGNLAETLLASRLQSSIQSLSTEKSSLEASFDEMYTVKKPQLRHFRGFLRNLDSTPLTEVTWYSSTSHELLTICECLCILKGIHISSTTEADKWAEIKKHMTRYDFKTWYLNLAKNVEKISIEHVQRVQHIIMHDQTITYERVRGITMAGYHLLIAVAACLQFCTLAKDLKVQKKKLNLCQLELTRNVNFLNAVLHNPLK